MIGIPFGFINIPAQEIIAYVGGTAFLDNETSPTISTSFMAVDWDGDIRDAEVNDIATWVTNIGPTFDAANYDFRLDYVSGDAIEFTDSTGVWIPEQGPIVGIHTCNSPLRQMQH